MNRFVAGTPVESRLKEQAGPLRITPQDPEAEQSVLGAMVLSKNAIYAAAQVLGSGDFYREAHREFFKAILALSDRNEPVDAMTLADELRKAGRFEEAGGLPALVALVDRVPTAAHVEHYAHIVKRLSNQRKCIAFLTRKAGELYDFQTDPEKVVDELSDFCSTNYGQEGGLFAADLKELALEVHSKILKAKSGKRIPQVPSGFPDFDEKFGGWQRGALTTIEAPPKIGKSFLMMNSMDASARAYGTRIGYLILDMSRETLMLRLISLRLRRSIREIQDPALPMDPIERALSEIQNLSIKVVGEENVGNDMNRILRWMAYARKNFGTDLFFVDSFTQIEVKPERGQTDESYIAQMINVFQKAAKTLDVAVVGTVDLNYEGQAKGSSRWGYGPDAVYRLSLSEDKAVLTVESKFLRSHASGSLRLAANYRFSEVKPLGKGR